MNSYEKVKAWRAAHPDIRAARREESRKYIEKYPEKRKAIVAAYKIRNREKVLARSRESKRAERKRNPELEKARQKAFYTRKEALLVAIAGRPRPFICELCSTSAKTVFDHCHKNGNFRGWLCDRCNRTLGQVKDDVNLLTKMIVYLEKAHDQTYG